MSKGRKKINLEDLVKAYNSMPKIKKVKKSRDKYAGLEECIKNVRKCNCAGKLAYC